MDMRSKLKFRSREDSSGLMNKTLKKGESLADSPPHADLPRSLLPPPVPETQGGENLSAEERSLISSLSKVFNNHSSRPNKILVRIDHTKQENGQSANATGRLVRVEAVWIEGENVLPSRKQVEIDIQAPERKENELIHSDCAIRLEDSQEQLDQIRKIRPPSFNNLNQIRRAFGLTRQIAITYVPQEGHVNQSGIRSNGQFSKFKSKGEPSFSQRSVESYEAEEVLSVEIPFVKLHDIQLFLTKDEIKQKRIKDLLHANQKIHLAEKSIKAEIQALEKEMKIVQEERGRERQNYVEELEALRLGNRRLSEELESRNAHFSKIRNLSDLYLKQNNDLKGKLKEQTRLIQEMRRELSNIRDNEPKIQQKNEIKLPPPQPSIANIVSSTSPNLSFQQQTPKTIQVVLNPYQLNGANAESRLKMCRSQETFRLEAHQDYMLGDAQMPIVSAACEPSSKSQKSFGIRKNIPAAVPTQGKNLVRVAKVGDTSIHNIKDEIREQRDNKSISSYTSNLSGKSLSQRIGHIAKPKPKESKPGVLVDYMLDYPPPSQAQTRPDLPRFQLARK